ncbi:hypothetical protein QWI17_13810 [Gilvimarinus sp. SDUM040013]|uniref:Uncharacterized protein n=1 Tax=Gilvimarinus gilvus TaxID=3058038 RepID=A0ABU4RTH8_9GAMM|nr:hypothetical protein [Gilvimarinus sp. SDUM040013]MDO3386917.1 hypothetical protein [Gilvimarinus sp. SDUM040013]MDX6848189.1 hypothetical protein [Gilvimarinus sp. SDUM040013]
MGNNINKVDPEELLFTLDQLEQTTEIMGRVVSRLKRQLMQIQEAATDRPAPASAKSIDTAPPAKPRRTLH